MYIIVINSKEKKLRSLQKLKYMRMNQVQCMHNFNNADHPRKGDRLTVYIPKNAHGDGNSTNKTNHPLQITFYNNSSNSDRSVYQFLDLSAINEIHVKSIRQGIKTALELWTWNELENPTLDFNIRVTIISKVLRFVAGMFHNKGKSSLYYRLQLPILHENRHPTIKIVTLAAGCRASRLIIILRPCSLQQV